MGTDLAKTQAEAIAEIAQLSKQKSAVELEISAQKKDLEQRKGELEVKLLEVELMAAREAMRPHRLYHATIGLDTETGKYFCRVLEYDDPTEESFEISAFGDTPSQACDNFDSLWMGTHK